MEIGALIKLVLFGKTHSFSAAKDIKERYAQGEDGERRQSDPQHIFSRITVFKIKSQIFILSPYLPIVSTTVQVYL